MESILEKAQRLGIKPVNAPTESILQKAQRLGIQPVSTSTGSFNVSEPIKANLDISSPYQIPSELLKTGVNLALSPVRIGKQALYDVPKEVGALAKETPKNPALLPGFSTLGQFSEGLADTVGTILNKTVAAPVRALITGPLSKVISKFTGKPFDPESESSLDEARRVLSTPQNRSDLYKSIINGSQKLIVEQPEQIVGILVGANQFLTNITGKPVDIVSNVSRPLINETKNIASDVSGLVKSKLPEPVADQSFILDNYNRAVKPTIAGKNTPAQVDAYKTKVVSGVNAIIENKPNLSFTDEFGNIVKGDTPKTLDQFADSISQTRKAVFKEYDALAKSSGEKGSTVDLANSKTVTPEGNSTSIVDELDSIINDKTLPISNPEVISKAKALKDRLLYEVQTNADGTTIKILRSPVNAEFAQNLLEQLNAKLKAFYRNPTPNMASEASIDAMVANRLRTILDNTIEATEGTGYQALKKKYGALKAIEADVTKRAQVYAKQNFKGLLDFSDVFTSGQVINGILSFNPQQIFSGLASRASKEFLKWKNSPDRAIESLFNEASKGRNGGLPNNQSGATRQSRKSPTQQKVSSTQSTTLNPKSKIGQYLQNPKLGLSVQDITGIKLNGPIKDSILKELSQYSTKPLTVSKNGFRSALPDDRIDMRIGDLQKKAMQGKGLNDQEYKEVYGLLKSKGIDAKPLNK